MVKQGMTEAAYQVKQSFNLLMFFFQEFIFTYHFSDKDSQIVGFTQLFIKFMLSAIRLNCKKSTYLIFYVIKKKILIA